MIAPLSLFELKEYYNFINEQDEEIKCFVEMLENILPEHVGV